MWLRLRQIALVARELQPVLDDFRAVLGLEVCFVDPGVKTFGLPWVQAEIGLPFKLEGWRTPGFGIWQATNLRGRCCTLKPN